MLDVAPDNSLKILVDAAVTSAIKRFTAARPQLIPPSRTFC
jgi:hypothetical protein